MILGNEEYLKKHFKRSENDDGWLAYKIFNALNEIPKHWVIEDGAWITEENLDQCIDVHCAAGVNVADSVDWIRQLIYDCDIWYDNDKNGEAVIWKMFIPDDSIIVVPRFSGGKIRTNRCQMLHIWDSFSFSDVFEGDDDEDDTI